MPNSIDPGFLKASDLFENQPDQYRDSVIGDAPRVGIEAAVRQGWDRYLLPTEPFVGLYSFGASAPAAKLYEHFGITAKKVVEAAKGQL